MQSWSHELGRKEGRDTANLGRTHISYSSTTSNLFARKKVRQHRSMYTHSRVSNSYLRPHHISMYLTTIWYYCIRSIRRNLPCNCVAYSHFSVKFIPAIVLAFLRIPMSLYSVHSSSYDHTCLSTIVFTYHTARLSRIMILRERIGDTS